MGIWYFADRTVKYTWTSLWNSGTTRAIDLKYSPKRENLLGTIREEVEGEFNQEEMDNHDFSTLDKLCITRWTIRATCFQKIIDNYSLLLSLWDECLLEKLDAETSARIKGCKSQMKSFRFFISGKSFMD